MLEEERVGTTAVGGRACGCSGVYRRSESDWECHLVALVVELSRVGQASPSKHSNSTLLSRITTRF